MTDMLTDIPRRYWHDDEWLGLPNDLSSPTYFHILGVGPEVRDKAAIEQRARELYQRLQTHAAALNNPSGQQVANKLLGIASVARQTLTDASRRREYVEQLGNAFEDKVRQLLQDWGVRTLDQFTPEVRELLMGRRDGYSLMQVQAEAVVDRVACELPDRRQPDVEDPAYPTYFDLLGVPETADEADRDCIAANRDRLVEEREAEARKTNRGARKRALLAEAHEIKSAASTLLSPGKRLKHLQQLRDLRAAAFKAFISDSVRPGQRELLKSDCEELVSIAERMRLGRADVAHVFAELGFVTPLGAPSQSTPFASAPTPSPGRLAKLPRVRMGSVSSGPRDFSFVLENAGDEEITVALIPRHLALKLYQQRLKLGPRCRRTVSGRLDTQELSMGSYKLPIEVRGPGGGGLVQVYVRVASVRLPVLLSVAYAGVLVMGFMAGSAFLVHLSGCACILLSALLWLRSGRWQYGAVGLGVCLGYLAGQRSMPELRMGRSAPPAPLPRVRAFSAEDAPSGILLTWQMPRPWRRGWTVRILRKKGHMPPLGANDGKLVFEGARRAAFFEDTEGLERGERYGYAVFVCENGQPPRFSAGVHAGLVFPRAPTGIVSPLPQGTLAVQLKALRQRWDARQRSIREAVEVWGQTSAEVRYLVRHRSALSRQAAELAQRLTASLQPVNKRDLGRNRDETGRGSASRAAEVQRRVAAQMLALLRPCLPTSHTDQVGQEAPDFADASTEGPDDLISPLPQAEFDVQTAAVRKRWQAIRVCLREAEELYGRQSPEVWRVRRQQSALCEQTMVLARQAEAQAERSRKAREAMVLDGRPERDQAVRAMAEDVYRRQLAFSALAACLPAPGRAKLTAGVALPPGFVEPIEGHDQHGNPVVARDGRRVDPTTGWPYEIWLHGPRMEFVFVASDDVMVRLGRPAEGRAPRPQWLYVAKYETTQAQWEQVTGEKPWAQAQAPVRTHPRYPAVNVTWHDCQQFLAALGRIHGQSAFRLPTAEEWEHACRAGAGTAYCFGDSETKLRDYAWYLSSTLRIGESYPHAVGRKQPNAWGLYDTHGNVWEWCQDSWRQARPAKGGAFDSMASLCRATNCQRLTPKSRAVNLGLRPLLPLPWEGIDEERSTPVHVSPSSRSPGEG